MSARRRLSTLLGIEKTKYLNEAKTNGGTAAGYRRRIADIYGEDPEQYSSLILDALMDAADKRWHTAPRNDGPDLFSVAGFKIPETVTRSRKKYFTGSDLEDEDESAFEKVASSYATVADWQSDGNIKLRKSAEANAKASEQMKSVDEAIKRAKGDLSRPLHEIKDKD